MFEFKLTNGEPPGRALAQAKAKASGQAPAPGLFHPPDRRGVQPEARNIATFKVELAA